METQRKTNKNTKLCVSIITLSTKDNVKLTKQLNGGFKRPFYCNEYKTSVNRING